MGTAVPNHQHCHRLPLALCPGEGIVKDEFGDSLSLLTLSSFVVSVACSPRDACGTPRPVRDAGDVVLVHLVLGWCASISECEWCPSFLANLLLYNHIDVVFLLNLLISFLLHVLLKRTCREGIQAAYTWCPASQILETLIKGRCTSVTCILSMQP